jgi:2-(1,2-epoxy-1,2-dihydrophenyl)acetyl-CoA isomerase
MNYETIRYEQDGGLAIITLNRPDALNCLNLQMENELAHVTAISKKDKSVRTLIITGAGRAFCAGGDVKDMGIGSRFDIPSGFRAEMIQGAHQTVLNIVRMEKPVIAMINGHAIGAGCNLAIACDIRIASIKAKFGEVFRNVGLTGDWGGTFLLPRIIGVCKTFELYYTGDLIDATQAKEIGLVNKVVEEEVLKETTYSLAQKLAEGPTYALGMTKRFIHAGLQCDLESALAFEAMGQALCMDSADYEEGVLAFREKRKPVFRGK